MEFASLADNPLVLGQNHVELLFIQPGGRLRRVLLVDQKFGQAVRPFLVVLLGKEFEFAQQVLVAQRVQGVAFEIGFPEVVHEPGVAIGQHSQGVHGFFAPLVMDPVEGERGGAGHVQPMEAGFDAQSAFINMNNGCLLQPFDNGAFHRGQRLIGALIGLGEGSQAQGLAEEVAANLPQTVKGQQLLVGKIDQQTPEVRAVLNRCLDPGGKGGLNQQSRGRTAFYFGLVLGDPQTQGWQFKDLAGFVIQNRFAGQ